MSAIGRGTLLCAVASVAFACGRRAQAPRSRPVDRVEIAWPRPSVRTPTADADRWQSIAPGMRLGRFELTDEGQPLRWWVVRLDLEQVTLRALAMESGSILDSARDPRVALAVDAGFFSPAMQPAGVLWSQGQWLGRWTASGGSGILHVAAHRAELLETGAGFAPSATTELAVQCGPRLIERDGSVGIRRDDGRRFARTAVCLRDDGRTLDFVVTWHADDPMHGPGLLALAERLAAPSPAGDPRGCESALNLDGGPSTGMYLRGRPDATHPASGPVPFVLVVRD